MLSHEMSCFIVRPTLERETFVSGSEGFNIKITTLKTYKNKYGVKKWEERKRESERERKKEKRKIRVIQLISLKTTDGE
jgi:hypothetical protein